MRRLAILIALGLVPIYGLGGVGLVDFDEAAYGEVARAMLASGDWLVPTLCGTAFYEKPPLLYWTAAAGLKLLGVGPAGVRLGTVLAGAVAPLALFAFARRPLGTRAAFASALVLAASLEFAVLARLAVTDMLLVLWSVVCLGALHRAFEACDRGNGWFTLACVAAGLAILTKGPIGLLFPVAAGMVELALRRRWRDVLRLDWLALALALAAGLGFSWWLALGLTQPGGFEFVRSLFFAHHVGRFSRPMQGHGGGVLYYLPVLLVGLFPWSLLLPLAVARTELRAGDERARFLRLFATFSTLTVVFFTIAATKLVNYIAPALPGFALLIGTLLTHPREGHDRALTASLNASLVFVGLVAAATALLPLVPARLASLLGEATRHPAPMELVELGPGGALAALILTVGVALAASAWRAQRSEWAIVSLALAAIAFYSILFHTVVPRVDAEVGAPLRRIAARAAELSGPDERVLMLGLRHRASVCFYGERATRFLSERQDRWTEAEIFGDHRMRIGISGEPQLARFSHRDRLEVIERDRGYVLFRIPVDGAAPGR
jgi:4-amino-4-deoxy-L-arabinose transferase-like glycosyltransferase